jgi:hypothetical protein
MFKEPNLFYVEEIFHIIYIPWLHRHQAFGHVLNGGYFPFAEVL